jgi:hypothetical protein
MVDHVKDGCPVTAGERQQSAKRRNGAVDAHERHAAALEILALVIDQDENGVFEWRGAPASSRRDLGPPFIRASPVMAGPRPPLISYGIEQGIEI